VNEGETETLEEACPGDKASITDLCTSDKESRAAGLSWGRLELEVPAVANLSVLSIISISKSFLLLVSLPAATYIAAAVCLVEQVFLSAVLAILGGAD
jgi:hypothetical protein